MNYKIYIPTYQRSDLLMNDNRRHTLSYFSKETLRYIIIVIRREGVEE